MVDIASYKNNLILLGPDTRTSLNLKKSQQVYLYEDLNNLQLILTTYELKNSLYRYVIEFDNIDKYLRLGMKLAIEGVDTLSISSHKFGNKYHMSIMYEIMDSTITKRTFDKAEFKTFYIKLADDCKVRIIDSESIEFSEKEQNDKVKTIVMPLIKLYNLNNNIKDTTRITQNWTVYHRLSEDFKSRAKLTGVSKYMLITEPDIGLAILKFYDENTTKINIKLLNLPGSFIRLATIFKDIEIRIEDIDLQRMSIEVGGYVENAYIIKYPDAIKKRLDGFKQQIKEKELYLTKIMNDTDSKLKNKNKNYKELVELHETYLKFFGKTEIKFIEDINLGPEYQIK